MTPTASHVYSTHQYLIQSVHGVCDTSSPDLDSFLELARQLEMQKYSSKSPRGMG